MIQYGYQLRCIFDKSFILFTLVYDSFLNDEFVIRLLVEVLEEVAPARPSEAALLRSQPLSKSKQNQKVRVALQKEAVCSLRAKNPDWTVLSTNLNLKDRILNN